MEQIPCSVCSRHFPRHGLLVLHGDVFFSFTCASCSPTRSVEFTRLPMTWLQLTHLVLHHLSQESPEEQFFSWKDSLCAYIDSNWDELVPGRVRTPTWFNTIAKELSTNPHIFLSGKLQGIKGFWALVDPSIAPQNKAVAKQSGAKKKQPRVKAEKKVLKRENSDAAEFVAEQPKATKKKSSGVKRERFAQREAEVSSVDSSMSSRMPPQSIAVVEPESFGSARTRPRVREDMLERHRQQEPVDEEFEFMESPMKRQRSDSIPAEREESLPPQHEYQPPPPAVAPIQESRNSSPLSSMSSAFQSIPPAPEDIVPAPLPIAPEPIPPPPAVTTVPELVPEVIPAPDPPQPQHLHIGKRPAGSTAPTQTEEHSPTAALAHNHLRHLTPEESFTLIQQCDPFTTTNPTLARLKRRLVLAQQQKLRSLKRLDLDAVTARSLKSYRPDPEPMPRVPLDDGGVRYDLDHENRAVVVFSKRDVELDKCITERIEVVKSYNISVIPPPFSLASKIYGSLFLNTTLTSHIPFASPYTGVLLKPYIWRDFFSQRTHQRHFAPQYRILELINSLSDAFDGEGTSPSIDYVYFQPMHKQQVNEMLSRQFWPGIDVSEHLDRPDLSVVALYKRVVVGCAFIMPDGYITFIMVKPGWQRAGIARFMLHHLIQSVQSYGKDVTLHVSANNRAMILYQSFGFKAEEFVVNFYDKYLPVGSQECRNALFLRMRR
ncbi:Cysteine-rich protein 2-binding protein [Podochytrium sp. JEL0797]|nr:Cysteine-rich protein 2-binding protein [Podochytrium sp. JEL0797]